MVMMGNDDGWMAGNRWVAVGGGDCWWRVACRIVISPFAFWFSVIVLKRKFIYQLWLVGLFDLHGDWPVAMIGRREARCGFMVNNCSVLNYSQRISLRQWRALSEQDRRQESYINIKVVDKTGKGSHPEWVYYSMGAPSANQGQKAIWDGDNSICIS